MVAGGHVGDVGPDALDDAGALVPPTSGSFIDGMSPVTMWSSEWHSPAATILTSTSLAFGSSRSTSVTSHFPGWENNTAALVFMTDLQ